jgi:hypothetical protein
MSQRLRSLTFEHRPGLGDAGRLTSYVIALLSIGAGVIHISAAADHVNLPVMMAGFLFVAAVQVGFGGLMLWRRPSRLLLVGFVALMLGSIQMWLMSRTVGLPFLPGGHMEPIGFKDGVTVLFEIAALPGAFLLMSRELPRITLPSGHLGRQLLAGLGAGMFALAVPALVLGGGGHHSAAQMGGHAHGEAAESGHGSGGHGHGEEQGEGPFSAHAEPHGSAGHGEGGHGGDGHGKDGQGHDGGEAAGGSGGSGGGHAHGASSPGDASLAQGGGSHPHGGTTGGNVPAGHTDHGGSGGGMDHGPGGHGDQGRAREGHGDHGSTGEQDTRQHGGHGGGGHGGGGHEEQGGGHGGGGHEEQGGGHEEQGDGEHGGGHGEQGGGHGEGGHGGGHAANPEEERRDPPLTGVVTQRAGTLEPKAPGTKETVKLQYGPYEIPPGGDANQVGVEFSGVDGYIVSAKPNMRFADGSTVGHDDKIHLHHAHLFRADRDGDNGASSGRTGAQWVFGAGGEQTEGSFEKLSEGDPSGKRFGLRLYGGDPMLMVFMPMNMSDQNKVAYLEFEFEFVHGTPEAIKAATGTGFTPLRPVLHGTTFNVPKTGDHFSWPLDIEEYGGDSAKDQGLDHERFNTKKDASVQPGIGDVWTAPADGVIVGAAGHMHEGGTKVVFNNLGSETSPCPNDSDKYPGTTIFESRAYYPPGVFPTHMLMGTTQTGWRAYVKKGDRIATNGVYDTRNYAFPDQMSVVGMYYDDTAEVKDSDRCRAVLVDEPGAAQEDVIQSVPHQDSERGDDGSEFFHAMAEQCVAGDCDDHQAPPLPRGPQTDTIHIQDFKFSPGDMDQAGPLQSALGPTMSGAPVVRRGDRLRFVNHDYPSLGGTRHAITSCSGPCNGPDVSSYPNSNGLFYSGPMGYTPLSETSSNENQATPTWELDTAGLQPGYHTFYCFQHRWMRGAFYVEE